MTLFAIITIAAFPRIINLYEDKKDVRPIISKLTAYFMLIAFPLAVLSSLYSSDIVEIFANAKFEKASMLIPYFAFGAVFLSFAEYTTMQYHLANKTYINTILKVFTGILGLGLNFILIKHYGILGAGIATLITNFIYFLSSTIIVLPNLNWQIPYREILKIVLSFVPLFILFFIFKNSNLLHPIIQILILLVVYYAAYYSFSFVRISSIK